MSEGGGLDIRPESWKACLIAGGVFTCICAYVVIWFVDPFHRPARAPSEPWVGWVILRWTAFAIIAALFLYMVGRVAYRLLKPAWIEWREKRRWRV